MQRKRNLQFVWPKDGPRGRGHRGFFGRLNNIITGKGPDVFLQHKKSTDPIKPDEWQNWDSYAFRDCHALEQLNPVSRGYERYDPHTRRYVNWATPHDWFGLGVDGRGVGAHNDGRTRFTREEWVKMKRLQARNRTITPAEMGDEWNDQGPMRWSPQHNDFWRNAHRQDENFRQGLPRYFDPNPLMQAHQNGWWDLQRYMEREDIYP